MGNTYKDFEAVEDALASSVHTFEGIRFESYRVGRAIGGRKSKKC